MLYFAVWRLNIKKIVLILCCFILAALFLVKSEQWFHNRTVAVLSWSVANKIIVVDPGHGGVDPGAIGPGGTLEKDITLGIAKRLAEYLAGGGAMVVMTRDSDSDLGKSKGFSKRKREDLEERYNIVTQNNTDIYINLQVNSFRGKCSPGGQTFYYPSNVEGKFLATHIQNELRRILQNTDRVPLPLSNVFMLRKVKIPSVVIEVGFLSNPVEERLLSDKTYQNKIAYAIYSGIVRYLADEKVQIVLKEMK